MRKLLSALALGTALTVTAPAMAAETIWLDSDNSPYSGYQGYGNALSFSSGGINVSVTGWSINGSGTINDGNLGVWSSGLGVQNSSGDNSHTIDNSGFIDFIILEFDQIVSLGDARFNTGWHGFNDTDATIGFLTAPLGSLSLDGLNQSALSVFSPYTAGEGGASGSVTRNINPVGNVGNIWMISATSNASLTGNDGFKLENLRVESAVPEPATWAMMLLGFAFIGGALRLRRREEAKVNFAF